MWKIFIKIRQLAENNQKGYAILFTIIIVSAISVITAGLSSTAYKQLILSSLAKDSQSAFYQADTAGDCALYADRINPGDIVTMGGPWSCGDSSLTVDNITADGYTIYPITPNSSSPCFRIDVTKTITSGPPTTPSWESGRVSWWKLDEDATDSAGTNDGTPNGGAAPTSSGCHSGQCYSFDGSNDSIGMGDVLDLGTQSWTYSLWFKETGSTRMYLLTKGASAGDNGLRIETGDSDNDQRGQAIFGYSSGYEVIDGPNIAIDDGSWHNIAVVFDRTGNATFYTDGVAGTPVDITGYSSENINSPDNFIVSDTIAGVNGAIDEVMAWNRALSSSEIQDVYNSSGSSSSSIINTKISAKGYNICKMSNIRTVERELEINYEE